MLINRVVLVILEEKGIMAQKEWEKRIEAKIHKSNKKIVSYRALQFES